MNLLSDDDLFLKIIEGVTLKIQKSANYSPIPAEELEGSEWENLPDSTLG